MKRYLVLLCFAAAAQSSLAESPRNPLLERQIASCHAWAQQLSRTVGLMHLTGALSPGDASASKAVVDLLASRCESVEARRMADLLVVTLDVLTDAPNQP
jgi:hypothetical protein